MRILKALALAVAAAAAASPAAAGDRHYDHKWGGVPAYKVRPAPPAIPYRYDDRRHHYGAPLPHRWDPPRHHHRDPRIVIVPPPRPAYLPPPRPYYYGHAPAPVIQYYPPPPPPPRYVEDRYYIQSPPVTYTGYRGNGECEWLRDRAERSRSAEWWHRYRACIDGANGYDYEELPEPSG
jgi:hypothetical protein